LVSTRLVEALESEDELQREPGSSTRKQRQEVIMLLSALLRLGITDNESFDSIGKYLLKEANKFEASEVHQLVSLLYEVQNESPILALFPATWKDLIESSRKRIAQIKAHYS
jgi:hypothetical protein